MHILLTVTKEYFMVRSVNTGHLDLFGIKRLEKRQAFLLTSLKIN